MIGGEQLETLASYLAEVFESDGPLEVRGQGRIAMGQSRGMHVLDLAYADSSGPIERRVVVRVEQWGLLGTSSRTEVQVMQALHRLRFPVAEVLAYEPTGDVLGQPFFVMDFVEGSSTFDKATADEYVVALHRLHELDTAAFDFLDRPDAPEDAALLRVEHWYGLYRSHIVGEPSPLVDDAAQWLRNHAPVTDRLSLVHGDPGPGNYMHLDSRVVALVDWEFSHLGDADEDWAYLIAMRGSTYFSQDEWLQRIERLCGHAIDEKRLLFWKALNFLKGVAVDQTAHRIYVDRKVSSPNLLAIATGVHLNALRRLCEAVF